MAVPKIALVQDWLTGFAGGEQVLLAVHELYPDAPIYTSLYSAEKTPQFAGATVIPSYLQKLPAPLRRQQLAIPLMPQAFESFNLKEYDLVISVGGGLSKGVITQPDQPHLSYCHTPMRYIWHLAGDYRAEGWLRSWAAHNLRIWDVVSSQRVDRFLANSQTVADRIGKIYRQPATVLYPPVDTSRFRPLDQPPGDYFLSVCRLIAYKRVDLIIEACKKAKTKLKVVGGGPDRAALEKLAAGSPFIEFLGRVADTDLPELYGKAKAFVIASEEDFGIVPVEAMAAGRPVVAYAKGGATESVVAGETGAFFEEQTPDSLAETLGSFDPAAYDPRACRRQAETFDTAVFKRRFQEEVTRALPRG